MKFQPITILFALTLLTTTVYPNWNPTDIATTQHLPSDPEFEHLKRLVYRYLEKSWVTQEKAQLIMELIAFTKPKICVDIGSFTGSSSLPMAATLKYLNSGKVYLIDAWSPQEAVKNISMNDPNYAWWSALQMQKIKDQCEMMIHQWELEGYCQIIHDLSERAAQQIDEIDFLHLDGDFSAMGSLLDATLYVPKVKSGGYILLSDALTVIDHMHSKKTTIWFLYHECELISELENGNVLLFKKQ
jgi:hypothetical protein